MTDKPSKGIEDMSLDGGPSPEERRLKEEEENTIRSLADMGLELTPGILNREIKEACDRTPSGSIKQDVREKLDVSDGDYSFNGKAVSTMSESELRSLRDTLDKAGLRVSS